VPVVLTPTAPVRFTISRLRQSIAEESRFSDEDLLALINDGYRQAVGRAQALPTITTVLIAAGDTEGALPSDWDATIGVFAAGVQYEAIPLEHSTRGLRNTFWQLGNSIFVGLGDQDATTVLTLLYSRRPDDLGYDDVPEWGREWDPLLYSYAAWRCVLAAGGAQTIRKAQARRAEFDLGLRNLRRQVTIGVGAAAGAQVKQTIVSMRGAPIAG